MADLDELERRMEERWREHVDAKRAQRPQDEVTRLYDAYLGAVDDYMGALDDYMRRKRDLDAEAAATFTPAGKGDDDSEQGR